MKTIKFILITILFLSIRSNAQQVPESTFKRGVTMSAYLNASFNGITLNAISQTKGNTQSINNLFSTPLNLKELDYPEMYRVFSNNDIEIWFHKEGNNSEYQLSSVEVKSSNIQFAIDGQNFKKNMAIPGYYFPSDSVSYRDIIYEVTSNDVGVSLSDYVHCIHIGVGKSLVLADPNKYVTREISYITFP